jgi:hypothetical protein
VKLKVGQTLHSVVDATTVIVVKASDQDLTLTCGGAEMSDAKVEAPTGTPAADAQAGTQLGKRYTDDALGLEVLCTKAGTGTLAANGTPLPLKDAKPLPASD